MKPFTVLIVLSGDSTVNEETKTLLLERQNEYKMAALRAKKQGDVERAKSYFKTSKVSYYNQEVTTVSL